MSASERELLWSDEFEKPGAPDATKWDYEEGFVRNREAQYYTKGRLENARVEDGCLVIEARKEVIKNPGFQQGSGDWRKAREKANYTSAALITLGKASWRYGRVEVRAKVPKGTGMWPAIWMMGTDRPEVGWPRCGEIDIMEQLGRKPKKIHGTLHWSKGKDPETGREQHVSRGGGMNLEAPADEGFHIFAIEWSEEAIEFFCDGKGYHKVDLTALPEEQAAQFRKPHYLLINLAIGGTWGGKIDEGIFPQKYLIDYVRVYQ